MVGMTADTAPTATRVPHDLEGRHAVVTGATGATGAAVVARLVAAGARVLGVARKPPVEQAHDDEAFVAADLTRPDGARAVVERVAARWGRADVVVHVGSIQREMPLPV